MSTEFEKGQIEGQVVFGGMPKEVMIVLLLLESLLPSRRV
jgi:hypothetical protein